mmetsp:Transcript_20399/g.50166  ORF Transcript_20399/g.50166 Transcript_20399/m.50166 type:complete len:96 (-) Transcript_20399:182-469(-)
MQRLLLEHGQHQWLDRPGAEQPSDARWCRAESVHDRWSHHRSRGEHHAWQENARHKPGSRRTQVLWMRLLFAWTRRVDLWQAASRGVRSEPTATY